MIKCKHVTEIGYNGTPTSKVTGIVQPTIIEIILFKNQFAAVKYIIQEVRHIKITENRWFHIFSLNVEDKY